MHMASPGSLAEWVAATCLAPLTLMGYESRGRGAGDKDRAGGIQDSIGPVGAGQWAELCFLLLLVASPGRWLFFFLG